MVKYVADSSCDIYTGEYDNFYAIPLIISTEEKEFVDNSELKVSEMLDYLAAYKGRSYSACPSPEGWLNAFEGADEIYVVTMTSKLSGSYSSANIAKEMYISKHPDAKICIIDSLSTGAEIRMVLEKIMELKSKGMEFEQVEKQAREYHSSTRLFFVLKSLHNLAQNGRINKAVAAAIGMLHVGILGTANEEGDIEPINKCRGDKRTVAGLIAEMKKAGYSGGRVRICYVENDELARAAETAIKQEFEKADILVYPAGGLCSYYAERGGIIVGCEC